MRFPLGYSNFAEVINGNFDFIDKTELIKKILDDNNKVIVLIRPRRFGKTLNLSMLHHFLASEVFGVKTQGMFDNLKIAHTGDQYMQHHGKYPVIFITLKDVKDHQYEIAFDRLRSIVAETYRDHRYLLESAQLSDDDKDYIRNILSLKIKDEGIFSLALRNLSYYLFQHYQIRPWLLIDEYDTPIHASYIGEFYPPIINLMRGFYGSVLKDNPYLEKAVITGILRISKESLFSGVNHLEIYSMLRHEYGDCFGFTENEVDELLQKTHLMDKSDEIKYWYNGYLMGNTTIYNPWSIVHCLSKQGQLQPYWVNTSDNALIQRLFARAGARIKQRLEKLLSNETIEVLVEENMVFGELKNNPNAIWSLLLFAGYLKVASSKMSDRGTLCQVLPPNYEVSWLYGVMVDRWFSETMRDYEYQDLLNDLISGNIDIFEKELQRYLLQSMSYFDVSGHQPEKFYHGFVMGLLVSLKQTHKIKSNRESGYGRYDVMIIPNDKKALGIIIEFKTAEENEDLEEVARLALQQIDKRHYAAEMLQLGINNILKIGMAFKGKQIKVLIER